MSDLLITRSPLRDRDGPLSSDVADAIEMLVTDNPKLPVAIDKAAVVDQLIVIANIAEDGQMLRPSPASRKGLLELYSNRLTNSSVFQAGYKHYERRASFPVVPVTDFFFRVIYAGGSVQACLNDMSEHEIMNSLPKRKGRVRSADTEDADYLRDQESGEVLHFGELAGIVVFPPNAHDMLLRAWLERRTNNVSGHVKRAVNALERARPESVAVERLKEHTGNLGSAMTRALPTPKRKDR